MGSVIDAYGARTKHNVMADTWGHMCPEPGSKHPCKILIMHHDGQTCMLDRVCENNSPMEYELACSVMDMFDWADGIHEVDCILWFYKSVGQMYLGSEIGRVIKAKVKTLYSTADWNSNVSESMESK